MIELTKLDESKILVNERYIEMVEETPDTVVTFSTGRKILVKESRQEIKNLVRLENNFLEEGKKGGQSEGT